ncbi:XRE family transcriptional regulator [Opitutus sp. ER46]|uniref:XRE family transcriptional regulator n=1 Tax=Opitutus sp. ER46 TaxID=2161864 RepID=UPI000D3199CD|nr:XRE family transcriptional regulator [Opitutus sp. ER46]PTX91216.1 XRE family transcriptional regulator [Opitutus sp. ER46]
MSSATSVDFAAAAAVLPHKENLRFILGLKLSRLRKARELSFKDLSERTGLTTSYLNEIEKGKKYPKPEKIAALANALGTSYDELVSLQLGPQLDRLAALLKSGLLQALPLHVFGLSPADLVAIASSDPERISALFDTLLTIARRFDVKMDDLLLAAMRSYVEQNHNYFEDLEVSSEAFRAAHGWPRRATPDMKQLRTCLIKEYKYSIDDTMLATHPDLQRLRAVSTNGDSRRLYLNSRLSEWQQAFLVAREIGARYLGLNPGPTTSPLVKVESYPQLIDNFRASYFAGALLLNRTLLEGDLRRFFSLARWEGEVLVAILEKYQSTPEMLFHRLTQILPRLFALEQMYFIRFDRRLGTPHVSIGKELQYHGIHGTHSIKDEEHYCRRVLAVQALLSLEAGGLANGPIVHAQRTRDHATDEEFFNLSVTYSQGPGSDVLSCVSIGFRVDEALKRMLAFWNDSAVPSRVVGSTCERCPLTDCAERAAAPVLHAKTERRQREIEAIAALAAIGAASGVDRRGSEGMKE